MVGAARLLALAAGAVGAWVAAPWVSMATRGTIDQRHVASWADLPAGGTDTPGPTGPRRSRAMPAEWDTIPGPRPDGAGASLRSGRG